MAKKGTVAAGVMAVIAIGGGWLGATAWSSHRAEAELKALLESTATAGLRVTKLDHRAGFMHSTGRAELALVGACGQIAGIAGGPIALAIDYRMSHAVTPTAIARFDWTMEPAGAAGDALRALLGAPIKLTGAGSVGLAGTIESSLALPAIRWQRSGSTFEASPSSGHVAIGSTERRLAWQTDRLVMTVAGQSAELHAMAFEARGTDTVRGFGSSSVTIDRIEVPGGTITGMRVATDVVPRGERVDVTFRPEIKSVAFGGQTLSDLGMDFEARGLHGASIETIGKVLEGKCDIADLTDDDAGKLADALRTLLAEGFSFGIPKLGATVPNGRVAGMLSVEVARGTSNVAAIAGRLQSAGEIRLPGEVLGREAKSLAVGMLGAVDGPDGLSLGYAFADGKLLVNGRAVDARPLTQALRRTDQQIAAFLGAPQTLTRLARGMRAASADALEASGDDADAKDLEDAEEELRAVEKRRAAETVAGRKPRD